MSFVNLNMYLATIPVYDKEKGKEEKKEEDVKFVDGIADIKDLLIK